MSKGLEALAYLMERQDNLEKYGSSGKFSISKLRLCLETIEKELKALEIIKKKQVDIHNLLESKTYEQYNGLALWLGYKGNLTKEEFELLKEVLE